MNQDILSYIMNHAGSLSLQEILVNFIAAIAVGGVIFLSYRFSHSGALYSGKFNVSLWMLTLVTTLVMCVIGNNIALSLGMVGALSIVRFRTAIKDARDTAYIFLGGRGRNLLRHFRFYDRCPGQCGDLFIDAGSWQYSGE